MKFTKKNGPARPQEKFRVEGNLVTVKKGGMLPPRCVKCNEIAKIGVKQRLRWLPTWLLPFSPIVRAIVGKNACITIGLCSKHLKKSFVFEKVGWFLLFLGVALFFSAFFTPYFGISILGGLVLFLIGLIIGSSGAPVKAVYMDNYMVKVKGCCKDFLDSVSMESEEE